MIAPPGFSGWRTCPMSGWSACWSCGRISQPAPGSMAAALAARAARQSVKVTADDLDFLRLAVLDALMTLDAHRTAVPVTELLALLGGPTAEVLAALEDLRVRALVWGDDEVGGVGGDHGRAAVVPGPGGRRLRPAGDRTDRGHRGAG